MENQINNDKNQRDNNGTTESRITKVLYNQVSLVLAICGVFLGGFIFLTSPSRDNNTALQLQDARIIAQRETIDNLTKIQQNDTQEVKAALKDLILQIQAQQQEITKLTTIINERIPSRK